MLGVTPKKGKCRVWSWASYKKTYSEEEYE